MTLGGGVDSPCRLLSACYPRLQRFTPFTSGGRPWCSRALASGKEGLEKSVHDRFTLTNDQSFIDGCRIRIPNLGWVLMRELLRTGFSRFLRRLYADLELASLAWTPFWGQQPCGSLRWLRLSLYQDWAHVLHVIEQLRRMFHVT